MQKIIITFLVGKFIEKVYDDGLKEVEPVYENEVVSLGVILTHGLLKNLPIFSKIFK